MRRLIPDEIPDDNAFLYAKEATYYRGRDRWRLSIDPDSCLAGPAGGTDIETIRTASLDKSKTEDIIQYTGKILFSAGVVLVVDSKQVLLRRTDDAPDDPGKWTSPAGRCDGTPRHTALKEFYEELAIWYKTDDRPVFVTVNDASKEFTDIYESSLAETNNGRTPERDDWICIPATDIPQAQSHYTTIQTEYGNQIYSSEMLPYFDEESNTLELRLAVEVDTLPDIETSDLIFRDPEFDRKVDRFGSAEIKAKREADSLVPTDEYFATNFSLLS